MPTPKTLEDLIQAIEHRLDISPQRRRDLISGIRCVARGIGMPPADIPASVNHLRKTTGRLHHKTIGVSKGRLANAVSAVRRGLEICGVVSPLGRDIGMLSPTWRCLYDRLPKNYARVGLARFIRFCSIQGIEPGEVSDAASEGFREVLEQESLGKNPRAAHQTACRLWNRMSDEISEWPKIRLAVPRYETRIYAADMSLLPQSVRDEFDGYIGVLAGNDPFRGPRPYRPASLKAVAAHVRAYVSALHHSGVDITRIESLKELVSSSNFEIAIRWHWERAGNKASKHIGEIAWTIRNIAVKHLKLGDDVATYFREKLSHFEMRQSGLSDKNRRALAQFESPEAVRKYLLAPEQLWQDAHRTEGHTASLSAQSAIAIEILIFAPLRIENLNGLRLDRHLKWREERLHIHIPADEVKNRQTLEFLLPAPVSRRVKAYVERYRGTLTGSPSPFLFPGRHGRPKDRSCLSRQISKALLDASGIRLTPHQFRHAAAKILLDRRPGHYEVVRQLLGHNSTSTVYESYSGTETRAAHAVFDEVILDARMGVDLARRHRRAGVHNTPHEGSSPAKAFDPLMTPLSAKRARGSGRKGR